LDRVRIGILGAAAIAPMAIIKPAAQVDEAEVVAVAARDRVRADAFARKHHVARVHDTYEALVADPDVDAVYIPLPNGLHGVWMLAALEAGKHILCEKPFTANAEEAEQVAVAARQHPDLVVMEAFHWRYHPLAQRMIDIVNSGEIGEVSRIETWMCFPLFKRADIRWQLVLAGGAMMDGGCYAVHMLRTIAGAEPEVVNAVARMRTPGVDRYLSAHLRFADGRTGRVTSSMWSSTVLRFAVRVEGSRGVLNVVNPLAPQYLNWITVTTGGKKRRERVQGYATYRYQLEAFTRAVLHGEPPITGLDDAVANMRVIDAAYRAAGLDPRQPTT
jgi:predicted dehydrogenase